MKKLFIIFAILALIYPHAIFAAAPRAVDALAVIPGEAGFGIGTLGGYGATNSPVICIVDSLNEDDALASDTRNGVNVVTGGLREILEATESELDAASADDIDSDGNANTVTGTGVVGRIVLFEVSGTIDDTDTSSWQITNRYVSVIGQSAPQPGITLKNIHLEVRAKDVLIQHLHFRVGDSATGPGGSSPDDRRNLSVIATTADVDRVVVDHCSFSWGIDVNVLMAYEGSSSYNASNIDFINCIFSEPLHYSIHDKGPHSKNVAWNRGDTGDGATNVSLRKSVLALAVDRNPYVRNAQGVLANNIIYRYRDFPATPVDDTSHEVQLDMIGNLIINSNRSEFLTLHNTFGSGSTTIYADDNVADGYDQQASYTDWGSTNNEVRVWGTGWSGNACDTNTSGTIDTQGERDCVYADARNSQTEPIFYKSGGDVLGTCSEDSATICNEDADCSGTCQLDLESTPATIKSNIVDDVGAFPMYRDAIDTEVMGWVQNESDGYIVDTVAEAGGWLSVAENSRNLETDMGSTLAGAIPSSPHGDTDADGYTNLEEWIHDLSSEAETPYTPPTGETCSESTSIEQTTQDTGKVFGATDLNEKVGFQMDKAGGANICKICLMISENTGDITSKEFTVYKSALGGSGELTGTQTSLGTYTGTGSESNTEICVETYSELGDSVQVDQNEVIYITPTAGYDGSNFAALRVDESASDTDGEVSDWILWKDDNSKYDEGTTSAPYVKIYEMTGAPAPSISSVTVANQSYDISDIDTSFNATVVFSENVYISGSPFFEMETAENDLACNYSSGSGTDTLIFACGPLIRGMRTTALALKSSDISLGGGNIQDVNELEIEDLSLPALTGTVDIAIPGQWNIPNGYADYATLLTAHGYLIGDDFIEITDKASITITDEDGTSGHPIVMYFRAGYTGTLDLNSNDYYTVFMHPSGMGNVANDDGTDVVVVPFNGAASQ